MIKYAKVKLDFNKSIALYKCDNDLILNFNDYFVIETKYGLDLGKVLPSSISLEEKTNIIPMFEIIRHAEQKDLDDQKEYKLKADEALKLTKIKIKEHKLQMKLINIYFFLDGNKILFNFTSESRVDFRELVKDLAATYKTRIELRQIGVRDEAMLMGGFGVCGKEYCCAKLNLNLDPISIKMAKQQNLILNSVKISGVCGRLMCCLVYEFDQYQSKNNDLNNITKENGCDNGCPKDTKEECKPIQQT